jgi:hypothetical protein
MKVVASVQAKRSSSRGLVHYIAHSKIDEAKELSQREIFNEYANVLEVEKANDFLKRGVSAKRPSNNELHHLVISLKAEDFERLGSDEKEQQQSLKEITRHAMKQFETEIGTDKLNWAAGIHRNTDNPHVHIAIQKEYFDKNLEKKTLSKIPTSLLPHYEKTPNNEKTFAPGLLIESATEKLEEILQEKEKLHNLNKQKSQPQQIRQQNPKNKENVVKKIAESNSGIKNERDILARAILAKYYLTKSQENLASLEDHGDKRRFRIFDEITHMPRKMSLFDLERRAEKIANRIIKNQNLTDAKAKEEWKKKLVETELQKNEDGIKRIKTILLNLIRKENNVSQERQNEYRFVKPLAEKIKQNCRKENKKLPIPNLTPEDLEMLQTEALEKKEIRVAVYFEKVRKELSQERGTATRTDDEISKLKAQQTLNLLKIKSQEIQLKDFQSQKQTIPVEINGKKKTLNEIDSLIKKNVENEQKFSQKVNRVLGKIGLIEPKTTLKQLLDTKALILEKLVEKNDVMKKNLADEKSLNKTLDEFYKNDTNSAKENIQPKFSAAELAEVESLSFSLKLTDVYRENWEQQKHLIQTGTDKGQNENIALKKSPEKVIAGRAIAREILSKIEVAGAKEEFENFKKHRDFQKFEISNPTTGKTRFVSLAEIGLDRRGSILEQTLEYFLESRDLRKMRHALEKQVQIKSSELKEDVKAANNILQVARDIAGDFKTKTFFGGTRYHHPPIFTPKELITIELRIIQTTSQSEAKNLQKILDSADISQAKNLPAILQSFENKKENARSVENHSYDEQKSAVQVNKNYAKSSGKTPTVREDKTDIFNQDRGR